MGICSRQLQAVRLRCLLALRGKGSELKLLVLLIASPLHCGVEFFRLLEVWGSSSLKGGRARFSRTKRSFTRILPLEERGNENLPTLKRGMERGSNYPNHSLPTTRKEYRHIVIMRLRRQGERMLIATPRPNK